MGRIKGIKKYEKNIFLFSIHFSIKGHKKTNIVKRFTNPLYFLTSFKGSKNDSIWLRLYEKTNTVAK